MKIKQDSMACEAGEYENFTGIIMWGNNEGVVKDACFKLEEWIKSEAIVFYSGVWLNGIWDYGIWMNGTWEYGGWHNGIWKGGTWKTGNWVKGIWEDGIWESGTWEEGIDGNSKSHLNSPNLWKK